MLVTSSQNGYFPLLGTKKFRIATMKSGLDCLNSHKKQSPIGILSTLLMSSMLWHSKICILIWTAKFTKQRRLVFWLKSKTPSNTEIESRAMKNIQHPMDMSIQDKPITKPNISNMAKFKLFPTIQYRDYRTGNIPNGIRDIRKRSQGRSADLNDLVMQVGLSEELNPDWVEALMGFPPNWTSI